MNSHSQRNEEALKPAISFDDDDSWISKDSASFLDKILQDDSSLEGKMTIEVSGKDEIDVLDQLLEPLSDIENMLFDTDDGKPCVPHSKATNVSQLLVRPRETIGTLMDEDPYISSLLRGDLLEPELVDEKPIAAAVGRREAKPQEVVSGMANHEVDVISRIMTFLHHTEPDRRVVWQAEEIVRECQEKHHKGDRKFKNLPGTIMERLIRLLGADKFNQIYRCSQGINPHFSAPPPATAGLVSSQLAIAIAYGIHIASTSDGSESNAELVHNGVESLNSMTEADKQNFWSYISKQKGAHIRTKK